MLQYLSHSSEETIAIGYEFGSKLKSRDIVCFTGELAAGKTTFIKGLVAGATGYSQDRVNSPTFVYLNIYTGTQTVYHFDLYRLKDVNEFLNMGFDDFMHSNGICCIEWAERITPLLPKECLVVSMSHGDNDTRLITIQARENIQNLKK